MEKRVKKLEEAYLKATTIEKVNIAGILFAEYNFQDRYEDSKRLWEEIRQQPNILKEGIKIVKSRWDNSEIVNSYSICEKILIDYQNIDPKIYHELIEKIFTYPTVARLQGSTIDSLLGIALQNEKLALTKEQKEYAIKRATENDLIYNIGDYGTRYRILKNDSFTSQEKRGLVPIFYFLDDEQWDNRLDRYQWDIVNNSGELDNKEPMIHIDYIYDYSSEDILKLTKNEGKREEIKRDLIFLHLLHSVRPMSWEQPINPINNGTKLKKAFN